MKVELIGRTENGRDVLAVAIAQCYSPKTAHELIAEVRAGNFSVTKARRLIRKVQKLGHTSTLEHCLYTFAVSGVSRALSHQLVRHRIASFSQQSQRYVPMKDWEYTIPETIKENPVVLDNYKHLMFYIKLVAEEMHRLGIPAEDVRMVYPNAIHTSLVFSMNVRALINFFELRLCHRAQWEIRELAEQMLPLVRKELPDVFNAIARPCVFGTCKNPCEFKSGKRAE